MFEVGASGRNRTGLVTEVGEKLFIPFQIICNRAAEATNLVFSLRQAGYGYPKAG